jgi:hypothetical protein
MLCWICECETDRAIAERVKQNEINAQSAQEVTDPERLFATPRVYDAIVNWQAGYTEKSSSIHEDTYQSLRSKMLNILADTQVSRQHPAVAVVTSPERCINCATGEHIIDDWLGGKPVRVCNKCGLVIGTVYLQDDDD